MWKGQLYHGLSPLALRLSITLQYTLTYTLHLTGLTPPFLHLWVLGGRGYYPAFKFCEYDMICNPDPGRVTSADRSRIPGFRLGTPYGWSRLLLRLLGARGVVHRPQLWVNAKRHNRPRRPLRRTRAAVPAPRSSARSYHSLPLDPLRASAQHRTITPVGELQ